MRLKNFIDPSDIRERHQKSCLVLSSFHMLVNPLTRQFHAIIVRHFNGAERVAHHHQNPPFAMRAKDFYNRAKPCTVF
jgi:hypothetical protein